ncbi:hypothetical protein [Candidatus Desulforudis audaxviator]|nr:hypothetical protein [Candidatus Desulforudis audaxviator]AZK60062.1 hypothetical protein Daudx_1515 [Candidatus Desulforudis audaxviator]
MSPKDKKLAGNKDQKLTNPDVNPILNPDDDLGDNILVAPEVTDPGNTTRVNPDNTDLNRPDFGCPPR